jgi:2-polyprenyl-3-methyl-5-hydroxy-6-metoxy-1,4-benzoquinol methylase
MPETVVECPLCSSRRSKPFDQRKFRGFTVENSICLDCGLVFQSPRMNETESAVYYQAEYRRMYQGTEGPVARDLVVQAARARSLLDFALNKIPSVKRCLDIGCSTGLILKHFQAQLGCHPVGIEPDNAYRSYAEGQGLTVYPSLAELEMAPEGRFDLVVMSHVLEHMPDPVGYLSHLRESVLTPGGWFLIEVPNLYSHDSFEVAHLFAFSAHTLVEILRKAGMVVDMSKKHGQPNSAILPLYLTVLCHPEVEIAKSLVRPERNVNFKRKAGILSRRILEHLIPRQAWLAFADQ